MRIKWRNIFGIVFTAFLIVLLCKLPGILDRLPEITWRLPHYMDDPAIGIGILGLICVTLVAIVRLLTDR